MNDIGIIGLGVMGYSIAVNMLNHGFKVAGYNRTAQTTTKLQDKGYPGFTGYYSIVDFIQSLDKPRRIFLMISAGSAVDEMINHLTPYLEKGDIVMDGGNSYFRDSERRSLELADLGIYFYAVGVSGGEKGALNGPSIMPSGDQVVYPYVGAILEKIAAQKDGEACCRYIGKLGAGHYVKMVHNGIEYADMQLIAESVLMMQASGLSNETIASELKTWNEGLIKSYLLDITGKIMQEKENDHYLVDQIEDISSNKGTGKWTAIEALQQDVNVSLINSAFIARLMSNQSQLRQQYHMKGQRDVKFDLAQLRRAYTLGKLTAYAQGFSLYHDASKRYGYDLDLAGIASIFRAGCIIQSALLDDIKAIFEAEPELSNLLLSSKFQTLIKAGLDDLRQVSASATLAGLPTPLFQATTTYLNQVTAAHLGANIIQAQRDFFGAHTFHRIDQEGVFHHEWE